MSHDCESTPGNSATELARLSRVLATLCAGNRILLSAVEETALLNDMCRVIVDAGYRYASVGFAMFDKYKSIRWVASAGAPIKALATFPFSWDDTVWGQTALGTAIRTGKALVGRQVHTEPLYAGPVLGRLRDAGIAAKYKAVAAFPMYLGETVLGALVIASADDDAFNDDEVKLLDELVKSLTFGIAHLRSEAEKHAARAKIARMMYFDDLTGLPNRLRMFESLHDAILQAKKDGDSLALLHLDVGRYRAFFKVLGNQAAEKLLHEVSLRLAKLVQSQGMLARVGEAEFEVMLPHSDADIAMDAAQKIFTSMLTPVDVHGLLLDARVNIGIALFPLHACDVHALIRRANAAMGEVTPRSGGCAMYAGGQEQQEKRRLAILGDLHGAICHDELSLHYQPKVEIASRRLCGAEALVRWAHPSQGPISTQELVTLVEDAGMIRSLTDWVLEAAFRESRAWHDAGLENVIAVNLSAYDLYDRCLVDRISGLFSTWGVAPESIEFELTESALMADPVGAMETLRRIKQLDVKLSVDDFGTGYSSLSYLQKFPLDGLKIDRSFISQMGRSAGSDVIVSSTIELGHALGLKIIAEGVESAAIWQRLAALGCDIAQGYFISKPMPARQLKQWARAWAQTLPRPCP